MKSELWIIFQGYMLAYFLGSIPFGLILGKLSGIGDIRNIGSGNIGATNMLRTGNKTLAAATLLLDAFKGFVAVSLAEVFFFYEFFTIYKWRFDIDVYTVIYSSGIAAMLGHIFPFWLRFKGGKGVATAIGTFFAIDPLLGIIVSVTWLAVFLISKISSLSALIAFVVTTVVTLTLLPDNGYSLYVVFVTLIIFFTHRENISRLMKKEEHQWMQARA